MNVSQQLIQLIETTLGDNKAQDVQSLDVSKLTNITDAMIICTATSSRHASSLADKVVRACKNEGYKAYSSHADQDSSWILIDFSDVVVHVMLNESRELYSLEKLWSFTEDAR